jgi:hypothetical protein
MPDRFEMMRAATAQAVLRGPGHVPPELRQAASRGEAPEDLRGLDAKIREAPWTVSDEDVAALRGPYTQDELFEIIVAASMGAADERLRAGLEALERA